MLFGVHTQTTALILKEKRSCLLELRSGSRSRAKARWSSQQLLFPLIAAAATTSSLLALTLIRGVRKHATRALPAFRSTSQLDLDCLVFRGAKSPRVSHRCRSPWTRCSSLRRWSSLKGIVDNSTLGVATRLNGGWSLGCVSSACSGASSAMEVDPMLLHWFTVSLLSTMVVCLSLLKVQILGLNELTTLVVGVVSSSGRFALGASRVRVISERSVVGLVDELVCCGC